jgi:hypothetical protein
MKIPTSVLKFATDEEKLTPYKRFADYFNHYRFLNGSTNVEFDKTLSFAEKEEAINASLRKEIIRVANIGNMDGFALEQYITNPAISWATFAVVSAMIDMVLPESIIETIGMYTDVRTGGWGDSFAFDVSPRDLFVVSKAGKAQRTAEMHKQFKGQVTVIPEMRELSVQVSLYKVLSGKESLAEFVAKAVRSIETQMTVDVYNTFNTAMAALPNTATTGLRVAGYSQSALVSMCQRVTAWNQGAKAIIMGTQLALVNVLPDDANYRYMLDSDYVKIGYVKTAFGYDVLALPQVADITTPWGTVINDSALWVVSPSSQKLVKLCLEGATQSNTTQPYQNANLTQSTSIWKSWGTAVATSATAGVITL